MKALWFLSLWTILVLVTNSIYAQPFQNLDFEAANVSNLPPNQFESVSVTDGLPCWSAYIGTNQITQVAHNFITLGNANVGILGPQYFVGFQIPPLEGTYTAIIQAGEFGNQGGQSASIAQMGLIPASAKSVQFESTLQLAELGATFTNSLFVTVNGQNRPVVPLGNNVYGCDVSAFAGSVEELRFTMTDDFGNALILLDAISFSSEAVPEPTTWILTGAGLLVAFGLLRRHRHN